MTLCKQLVSLTLISVFLLQIFSRTIIILIFEINRDYIAKNLCVKKDEPNNCCKGKCHLKKELDKEEKQEQSPINPIKEKEEIQFYSDNKTKFSFFNTPLISELISHYSFSLSEKHIHSIFHPPQG